MEEARQGAVQPKDLEKMQQCFEQLMALQRPDGSQLGYLIQKFIEVVPQDQDQPGSARNNVELLWLPWMIRGIDME